MHQGQAVTSHVEKERLISDHFSSVLGSQHQRCTTLNWDQLHLPTVPDAGLDNPFIEEEVWEAIKQSLLDKASGPDRFNGGFYRNCWATIKEDIMQAFQ